MLRSPAGTIYFRDRDAVGVHLFYLFKDILKTLTAYPYFI